MEPNYDKTCFVIMPFGKTKVTKEHYDLVYKNIKETVESRCNLVCRRADDINKPGKILDDIIRDLHASKYVIADLSQKNPNVMYELGIRHSLKERTILLAQYGTKLPFDLGGERTIFYSKDDCFGDKVTNLEHSIQEIIQDDDHKDSPVFKVLPHIYSDEESPMRIAEKNKYLDDLKTRPVGIEKKSDDSYYEIILFSTINNYVKEITDYRKFKDLVRNCLTKLSTSNQYNIITESKEVISDDFIVRYNSTDGLRLFLKFSIFGGFFASIEVEKYGEPKICIESSAISKILYPIFKLSQIFFMELKIKSKIDCTLGLNNIKGTKIKEYFSECPKYKHEKYTLEKAHFYQDDFEVDIQKIYRDFFSRLLLKFGYNKSISEIENRFYEIALNNYKK